jgi:hypothetical protein
MKRALVAIGIAASLVVASKAAHARPAVCNTQSVRVSLVDAGATSMLEISARVATTVGDPGEPCMLAWSRLALSSSSGSGPSPHVLMVETFVDHERTPPMLLADGLSAAAPRDATVMPTNGPAVVALRMIVEDTDGGLKVELPRGLLPTPTSWARAERRVKSARDATAKFGELGAMPIPASPPGIAGGLGPTGPFEITGANATIVVECAPTGAPPSEALPTWTTAIDAFRATLPKRALDLSPNDEAGWDDLARHAWAAAMHSDPVVASLGVSSLAWLASGLDVQGTKLDASNAPKNVLASIGDVQKRLDQRWGAVGHLLPLGRPTTFRQVLAANPGADSARAKAAKSAAMRLATIGEADVASMITPSIVEGIAPIDPPSIEPPTEAALEEPKTPTEALTHFGASLGTSVSKLAHHRPHRRWPKKYVALALLGLALVAAGALVVREPRARREA